MSTVRPSDLVRSFKRYGWVAVALVPALVAVSVARAGGDAPPRSSERVARGRYLVDLAGCVDCHSPKKLTEDGPVPDPARHLMGHPADESLPPAPAPSGPWIVTTTGGLTAWHGPWGTTYARNLTPDPETGVGAWTEQEFIDTFRTQRHRGRGRRLLPPMPVEQIAHMTDEDLAAVFAYLRTIPAVKNRVPEPLPPGAATAPAGAADGGR